ncbi:hypothetical protein MN608_05703 [Microdochium nivale]|nr:hypothetical protein MN608_05703 [Microdochium nivale]
MKLLRPVKGQESLVLWTPLISAGARVYSPIMMVHATALVINLLSPYFFGVHIILSPANVEPTMRLFGSLAIHTSIDIWFALPQYINTMAHSPPWRYPRWRNHGS